MGRRHQMACNKLHRRFALRRKLHILRTLTKSKSVKKSSIVIDACLYIHKLKLQIQAILKQYQYLINHVQEVKVEKVGTDYVAVRLTCKKGKELLVSILEAFEEMNLDVVQARFTYSSSSSSKESLFGMEAMVQTSADAAVLNEAILMAIQRQTELST